MIDQWDEYREIGHGDNLVVIQHKYKDYVAYIILLRQVEKMQPFQLIFSFGIFEQEIIISWSQVMKFNRPCFQSSSFLVEGEQIGLIVMHLHEVQRLRKIKDERVILTFGGASGS